MRGFKFRSLVVIAFFLAGLGQDAEAQPYVLTGEKLAKGVGNAVVRDPRGNIVVGGTFVDEFLVNPVTGETRMSRGDSDGFLARYSATGDLLVTYVLSGLGTVTVRDVAVGRDGAVYAVGEFTGSVDFNPLSSDGSSIHENVFGATGYLLILDKDFEFQRVEIYRGDRGVEVTGVCLDDSQDIYVGGHFDGALSYDDDDEDAVFSSQGEWDVFLVKTDGTGGRRWAHQAGGQATDLLQGLDYGRQRLWCAGSFGDEINCNVSGEAAGETLKSAGSDDGFVLGLNPFTRELIHAERMGGSGRDHLFDLAVDSRGKPVVVGSVEGVASYGSDALASGRGTPGADADVMVVKLREDGILEWSARFGGEGDDEGFAVSIDDNDGILTTGETSSALVDLDPSDNEFLVSTVERSAIFLHRMDSDGSFVWGDLSAAQEAGRGLGLLAVEDEAVYLTGFAKGTLDLELNGNTHTLNADDGAEYSFLALFLDPRRSRDKIWDGTGDGVRWNDPGNWNDDVLPTVQDAVFLGCSGEEAVVLDTDARVASVFSTRKLRIAEGTTLTLSRKSSWITNALEVEGGAIVVEPDDAESFVRLNISGPTELDGATIRCLGGGVISMDGGLSYPESASVAPLEITSDGVGSLVRITSSERLAMGQLTTGRFQIASSGRGVISVAGVKEFDGPVKEGQLALFKVESGGRLKFEALETITVPEGSASERGVRFQAGKGTIDLPFLHQFQDLGSGANLTAWSGILVDHAEGEVLAPVIKNAKSLSFRCEDSAKLRLKSLVEYAATHSSEQAVEGRHTEFSSKGQGGVLDLSGLSSLVGPETDGSAHLVDAGEGGSISMENVSDITVPPGDASNRGVILRATGNSSLWLGGLQGFEDDSPHRTGQNRSRIVAGGEQTTVDVRTLNGLRGVSIVGKAGASLELSNLTSFDLGESVQTSENVPVVIQAEDEAQLTLPSLPKIVLSDAPGHGLEVQAFRGGQIQFSALDNIRVPERCHDCYVTIRSRRGGSLISFSGLRTFVVANSGDALASGFLNSGIYVDEGGEVKVEELIVAQGINLSARDGSSLVLTKLPSYQCGEREAVPSIFEALGLQSAIRFPSLGRIDGPIDRHQTLQISAAGGATMEFPLLSSVIIPEPADPVVGPGALPTRGLQLTVSGRGSQIEFLQLESLRVFERLENSSILVDRGGHLLLGAGPSGILGVPIIAAGGILTSGQLRLGYGERFLDPANLENSTSLLKLDPDTTINLSLSESAILEGEPHLEVDGPVELTGHLDVAFPDGYEREFGDLFVILKAENFTGTFEPLAPTSELPLGLAIRPRITESSYMLQVVAARRSRLAREGARLSAASLRPVVYYPLDGDVMDLADGGRHGRIEGGNHQFVVGVHGGGVKMDSARDSRIKVDPWIPGNSDFSVGGWIRADRLSDFWLGDGTLEEPRGTLLSYQAGDFTEGFSIGAKYSGRTGKVSVAFSMEDDAGDSISHETQSFLGLWHHLVGVADIESKEMVLYYDGREVARKAIGPWLKSPLVPTTGTLGGYDFGSEKNGHSRWQSHGLYLDDVFVLDRVIRADEVASLATGVRLEYDLASDFSGVSNPFGTWSFRSQGDVIGTRISAWNEAAFGGPQPAWASLENLARIPSFWKQCGPISDYDLLPGQIALHTPDNVRGPSEVWWQAPADGAVDLEGSTWHANAINGQPMNWSIVRRTEVAETILTEGILGADGSRGAHNPVRFAEGSGGVGGLTDIPVDKDDLIIFRHRATVSTRLEDVVGLDVEVGFYPEGAELTGFQRPNLGSETWVGFEDECLPGAHGWRVIGPSLGGSAVVEGGMTGTGQRSLRLEGKEGFGWSYDLSETAVKGSRGWVLGLDLWVGESGPGVRVRLQGSLGGLDWRVEDVSPGWHRIKVVRDDCGEVGQVGLYIDDVLVERRRLSRTQSEGLPEPDRWMVSLLEEGEVEVDNLLFRLIPREGQQGVPPTQFGGEDVYGVGEIGIGDLSLSQQARAGFEMSAAMPVLRESFEVTGDLGGAVEGDYRFNFGGSDLSGRIVGSEGLVLIDQTRESDPGGRFATDGNWYLATRYPDNSEREIEVEFSEAIVGLGMYVTSLDDNQDPQIPEVPLRLRFEHEGKSVGVYEYYSTTRSKEGDRGVAFVGYLNESAPFDSVRISGATEYDGFGFDELSVVRQSGKRSSQSLIGEGAVFTPLGYLPSHRLESVANDVSGNGKVVVGGSDPGIMSEANNTPVRWSSVLGCEENKGGIWNLNPMPVGGRWGEATDASWDGRWISSYQRLDGMNQAVRWGTSGVELLRVPSGERSSVATGISSDGSIVVGRTESSIGGGNDSFVWTAEDKSFRELRAIRPDIIGSNSARGVAVGAGGRVHIVGEFASDEGRQAYLLRGTDVSFAESEFLPLGDLVGGEMRSEAYKISADGTTVVGFASTAQGIEAFRWSEESNMQGLGSLGGEGQSDSVAYDLSGDGQIVVGQSSSEEGDGSAFVWTEPTRMRELQSLLDGGYKLQLPGWRLDRASGISDDGLVIVGEGVDPSGMRQAWVVVLERSILDTAFDNIISQISSGVEAIVSDVLFGKDGDGLSLSLSYSLRSDGADVPTQLFLAIGNRVVALLFDGGVSSDGITGDVQLVDHPYNVLPPGNYPVYLVRSAAESVIEGRTEYENSEGKWKVQIGEIEIEARSPGAGEVVISEESPSGTYVGVLESSVQYDKTSDMMSGSARWQMYAVQGQALVVGRTDPGLSPGHGARQHVFLATENRILDFVTDGGVVLPAYPGLEIPSEISIRLNGSLPVGEHIIYGVRMAGVDEAEVRRAYEDRGAVGSRAAIGVIEIQPSARKLFFPPELVMISEGVGRYHLEVRKEGDEPVVVPFDVIPGTAEVRFDFEIVDDQVLRFGAGDDTQAVRIDIFDELIRDPDERFLVVFSKPERFEFEGSPTVNIEIVDNEPELTPTTFAKILPPERHWQGEISVKIDANLIDGENWAWRFPWERVWHGEEHSYENLEFGDYRVVFQPAGGGKAEDILVELSQSNAERIGTGRYENREPKTGRLTVRFGPSVLSGMDSVGWEMLGTDESYRGAEARQSQLVPVGTHLIAFEELEGWLTPGVQEVSIFEGVQTVIDAKYQRKPSVSANVSFPTKITSYSKVEGAIGPGVSQPKPHIFTGQIRTSRGLGSGIVVSDKVVLTAAHLLYQTNSTERVKIVEFFPARYAGEHESRPLIAKGWVGLDQYVEARQGRIVEGTLAGPAGLDLWEWDIAAVFFGESLVRDGSSGFVFSDSGINNEWLVGGERELILSGYPYGVEEEGDGRLFASEPWAHVLTAERPTVFKTSQLLSYPGNSGGPLSVLISPSEVVGSEDGDALGGLSTYFPAAIFVGSSLDGRTSYFRSIDRKVAELIVRAASSAKLGRDYGSPGTSPPPADDFPEIDEGVAIILGKLRIEIEPAEALRAGAAWKIDRIHQGFTKDVSRVEELPSPWIHSIEFEDVDGWSIPAENSFEFRGDHEVKVLVFSYTKDLEMEIQHMPSGEPHLFVNGPEGMTVMVEYGAFQGRSLGWEPVCQIILEASEGNRVLCPVPLREGFYRARSID